MQGLSSVGGRRRQVRACCLALAVSLVGQTAAGRALAQSPGPPSSAQDAAQIEARRGAARAKLVEGDGLLKQGSYIEALGAFKEAYALFPSPKIHYNFGLALKGMGRNAEAMEAFDRFLAEANDASPDARARAVASRNDLLTRVGVVRVTAEVDGASILIDGREHGRTPQSSEIHLDPGPHMLTVDRGGGRLPFTERLEVRAGVPLSVVARFPDAPGDAAPQGVTVPVKPVDDGRAVTPAGQAPGWLRPAAWTAAGVGAVALVTGSVSWAVKESKISSFNRDPACYKGLPNDGGATCHDLLESGETARSIGIAGFIAAGVFGIASAAAFVVHGRAVGDGAGKAAVSFRCGVAPDRSGEGLRASCAGRF